MAIAFGGWLILAADVVLATLNALGVERFIGFTTGPLVRTDMLLLATAAVATAGVWLAGKLLAYARVI
jgi:hypothetical protein